MKKVFVKHKLEMGQVIPLVVLMMFAIIAMAALILDGGAIMSNRRTAQAAADAGALAGAQVLCAGNSEGDAEAMARSYSLTNGAANDEETFAIADESAKKVTVYTKVESGTAFFSRLFGEDNLVAKAKAVAGCYPPGMSDRMLPIAFYWQSSPKFIDPDGNIDQENICNIEDPKCQFWSYDYDYLIETLQTQPLENHPFDYIYIVADNTKVCQKGESGKIVCAEFDKDESNGNRVWIDLSKVEPSGNLRKIIQEGMTNSIRVPAWINGAQAVSSGVYDTIGTIDAAEEGMPIRLVTVPWYDKYCPNDPENNCTYVGTDDFLPDVIYNDYLFNKNKPSYRLRGFSSFVVTCVTKNQNCVSGMCVPDPDKPNNPQQKCPGYLATNPTNQEKDAIEGYFVINPPIITYTGSSDWFTGDYITTLELQE
jgi:hypothetical protein